MPLRITMTPEERLLGAAARLALHAAVEGGRGATLLVPSFAQALSTQKELAAEESSLSLGVKVTTPNGWIDERWEVWGDGRRMVSNAERLVLMRLALREAPDSLVTTTGMLDALVRIARASLAWVPAPSEFHAWGDQLTDGERAVCDVLDVYRSLLAERHLIERSEATVRLGDMLPAFSPIVMAGFTAIALPLRELLMAVSAHTQVEVVLSSWLEGSATVSDSLLALAAQRGVTAEVVENTSGEVPVGSAADELRAVWHALAFGVDPDEAVVPQGQVRLIEPEGPLAEWELVSREVRSLARAGMTQLCVVTPKVEDAWQGLAPRLASAGMSVSCGLRHNVAQDTAASAFFGFAQTVALLAELAQTWPGPIDSPAGKVPQLGDMSWWPPRELTDFLLSSISGVDAERARELDVRWRGNRSLTPQAVLDHLQKESLTSKVVAQATASVLRGRVGTAALQLARALRASGEESHKQEIDALGCIQEIARMVGAMGISASSRASVRVTLPLTELVTFIQEIAGHMGLSARLTVGADEGAPTVRICTRQEGSSLPRQSQDALVICGMTSEEWPLSPKDGAAEALLEKLGFGEEEPPLAVARRQLRGMLAATRRAVILERVRHDMDAKPTYPAVMLSELLACYGNHAGELQTETLGEGRPDLLISSTGAGRNCTASLPIAPAGEIGEAASRMVVVPREGQDALPNGLPSLSASQIESYLECPYKWFTLRRLGLEDNDATFSPLQMGSFAHRVLEVSRRMLMQHAAQEAGLVVPGEQVDLEGGDILYIPGADITPETHDLARSLVEDEFAYHLAHQWQKATTSAAQSLVPHTATEEYRLGALKTDLLSSIDFELDKFEGFAPRYFELRFGGSSARAHHVTYAGVDFVGSIDRVDVDKHGRAVVIDYKHKGAALFAREYDAFADESPATIDELVLPRRVQSLIYAQVVRRLFPNLKVVGAVYLSTMGNLRGQHEIAGVIDANAVDQVMGSSLSNARRGHLVVGGVGKPSFYDLLDETERRIAEKVSLLTQGHIAADPIDDKACQWCPVTNCERRRG